MRVRVRELLALVLSCPSCGRGEGAARGEHSGPGGNEQGGELEVDARRNKRDPPLGKQRRGVGFEPHATIPRDVIWSIVHRDLLSVTPTPILQPLGPLGEGSSQVSLYTFMSTRPLH